MSLDRARSSFKENDVTLLLSDITGLVEPLPSEIREKKIQSGTHYCEMLPLEKTPTEKYLELYELALENYSEETAKAVMTVSEKIIKEKGNSPVLVSLARAGTPAGILIKRYLYGKYKTDVPHYTISIIRGKGIDENALKYILLRHGAEDIIFVDGWTGKGAILNTLREAVSSFEGVSSSLAVLADPAYATDLCGTHEDFLIASSCLNCTVSGLISRTFLRSDIIGADDFHGCAFYGELAQNDRTYEFIESVSRYFDYTFVSESGEKTAEALSGIKETENIAKYFKVSDINLVKPGIGETTRVLLRRTPRMILVRDKTDVKFIGHILRLAEERNVPVIEYPLKCYRACGIIKNLSDV